MSITIEGNGGENKSFWKYLQNANTMPPQNRRKTILTKAFIKIGLSKVDFRTNLIRLTLAIKTSLSCTLQLAFVIYKTFDSSAMRIYVQFTNV